MHQKQNKGLVHIILSLFLTLLISSNALGAYTLVTPQMTSNTLPSGTVTYSTRYTTGLDGYKAFDYDNLNTGWASAYNYGWLAYQFTTSKKISKYSIYPFYIDGYHPKDWTFEGYNGTSWDILDTQTNITNWVIGTVKEFPIANQNSYTKYRINVSSNNGNSHLGLNELLLYESDVDITPPQAPQSLTSTIVYTDRIILNWLQNSEPDFLKYLIKRDGTQLGYTSTSTFTDLDLLAGTTYNYEITAIDINGNESSPSIIAVSTAPPAAPTNIADDVTLQAISYQAGLILSSLIGFVFWISFRRN